jgi:hypothetical protein
MHAVEIPATLSAFGAAPAPATATVLSQAPGERLTRTAAALGMCWGPALVSVFIPVAHFVLVPTFFIAGIALAIARAREAMRLLGVHGVCPRCAQEQDFEAGGRFTPSRSLDCPKCHNTLTLTADASAAARTSQPR